MSSTGKIPTDHSIEKILKNIAKESGLRRVDYTYRCGPLVNDPTCFTNEVSNMEIHTYDISFIDSDLNVMVLDDNTKREFIKILSESQGQGMTTGMILDQYLKNKINCKGDQSNV